MEANHGNILEVLPLDEPVGGEKVRSSISPAQSQLFIRTTRPLSWAGKAS